MIIVKNRELLIPRDEQYIGTIYDDNTANRQFMLQRVTPSGMDLSALSFHLDIEYQDNSKDTVLLSSEVYDDRIVLTWPITASQLQVPGTSFIQLRALDENLEARWGSFKSVVYVEPHIYTPRAYTGDLTELEQMEAQFAAFQNAEAMRVQAEKQRNINADAAIARTDAVVADVQSRLASGEFVGPVGPKGDKGAKGDKGDKGDQGMKGDKGDTGESGVVIPVVGNYTLSVDENGDLWCTYDDGTAAPEFEYDPETGNLYLVTEDEEEE